jgi:hypothetical protein
MAVLQAARAIELGKGLDEAEGIGLNRAIFYAAAKNGFHGGHRGGGKPGTTCKHNNMGMLGSEMYYVRDGYPIMGDKLQTPAEYNRQIKSRFNGNYNRAWDEARKICKSYGKAVLSSQQSFFNIVYKPRRDELKVRWSYA